MHRLLTTLAALTIGFGHTFGSANVAFAQSATDPKAGKEDAPKPPAGWKEYTPKDGTFAVWVPEKPRSQSTRERTSTINGQRIKINLLAMEMNGGPSYLIEELIVPAAYAAKFKEADLPESFKEMLASEAGGKVTEENDVKAGNFSGKEFRIEGKTITRARVFATGTRVLMLKVSGKKEIVDGDAAKVFLESAHLNTASAAAAVTAAARNAPKFFGFALNPEFKEVGPEGALLVGFEFGFSKFINRDVVRAVKPIYRAGEAETFGEQRGTPPSNAVTVKAKPGYAIGGIAVKGGLGADVIVLTFMKVVDGKLDPKDAYDSEMIGSDDKNAKFGKFVSDGTPVVGIVGKKNDKELTAIGLLVKGQEGYEPKK